MVKNKNIEAWKLAQMDPQITGLIIIFSAVLVLHWTCLNTKTKAWEKIKYGIALGNIWWCHMMMSYDDVIWWSSYDIIIWPRHMTPSYDSIIWHHHMTSSYDSIISPLNWCKIHLSNGRVYFGSAYFASYHVIPCNSFKSIYIYICIYLHIYKYTCV